MSGIGAIATGPTWSFRRGVSHLWQMEKCFFVSLCEPSANGFIIPSQEFQQLYTHTFEEAKSMIITARTKKSDKHPTTQGRVPRKPGDRRIASQCLQGVYLITCTDQLLNVASDVQEAETLPKTNGCEGVKAQVPVMSGKQSPRRTLGSQGLALPRYSISPGTSTGFSLLPLAKLKSILREHQ